MFHLMAVHGVRAPARAARVGAVSYETDRARFLGRGRSVADPAAMRRAGAAVEQRRLGARPDRGDPLRRHARARPGRDDRHGHRRRREPRRLRRHWSRSTSDRRARRPRLRARLDAQPGGAAPAQRQRSRRPALRAPGRRRDLRPARRCAPTRGILLRNRRGQSGLWGYGISGDLPIVLLRIGSADNIELVRQLVQAHAYWRLKGLAVDLVIWNEERDGYRQRLQDQIMGLIAGGGRRTWSTGPAASSCGASSRSPHEDRVLLQTVARVVFSDSRGTLAEQVNRRPPRERRAARSRRRGRSNASPRRWCRACRAHRRADRTHAGPLAGELALFNGTGGFTPDGREYVIAPAPGRTTAGALGQRARESALRQRRLGERQRLHVVRERARAAPDAVAQRPGQRRRRRGDLPARRRERRGLVADLAAVRDGRCGRRRVHRRVTASATASSSITAHGIRAELTRLRRRSTRR